ncbi:hypothetical protein VNO78_33554 [Psophocarpus tetragonolobus]|uniref:DUF4283 domain-containing protein n=1 Tax=Psophocarpus tetragonolobus TaxID=3891 RepID=A0AAN9NX65_PSOTE
MKFLSQPIQELWAHIGTVHVIDFLNDFFQVRFIQEKDYMFALFEGPWQMWDHYLLAKCWRPFFNIADISRTHGRKLNRIDVLMDSENQWIYDDAQIKNMVINHFKGKNSVDNFIILQELVYSINNLIIILVIEASPQQAAKIRKYWINLAYSLAKTLMSKNPSLSHPKGSSHDRRVHLISWKIICKPKYKADLGFYKYSYAQQMLHYEASLEPQDREAARILWIKWIPDLRSLEEIILDSIPSMECNLNVAAYCVGNNSNWEVLRIKDIASSSHL